MMRWWHGLVLLGWVVFAVGGTAVAVPCRELEVDLGPIAARWSSERSEGTCLLGPLVESVRTPEGRFFAVRPLYARAEDLDDKMVVYDYLWPLAGRRVFRGELVDRVLIFWRQVDDVNDTSSRRRTWLLPVYFQGRDRAGARYRAVFPLLGSIHEIFGLDRVFFVLFPLYSHSQKNDLDTHNFFWPIVSRTTGEGVYRFRVFPFYGISRRDEAFEKKFILWPVWTSVRYDYAQSRGGGYILFPLWGHLKLSDQESWWVLPPFFRFHRGEKMNLVYAPWPLVQWSEGEVDKLYLWPLWGRRDTGAVKSWFALWPIMWHWRIERVGGETHRFLLLPFLYHEEYRRAAGRQPGGPGDGEVESWYCKLWPLISYRRQGEQRRLRVLALWPLKESPPVERSWSKLWRVYEYDADGDCARSELLWGWYRHGRQGRESCYWSLFPLFDMKSDRRGEGVVRWNLLKGLVGYERKAQRKSWRLLYWFRLGGGKP